MPNELLLFRKLLLTVAGGSEHVPLKGRDKQREIKWGELGHLDECGDRTIKNQFTVKKLCLLIRTAWRPEGLFC